MDFIDINRRTSDEMLKEAAELTQSMMQQDDDFADELVRKADELRNQAEEYRKQKKRDAISQVLILMNEYGISKDMIMPSKEPRKAQVKRKLPPKYRDPKTGVTWAGRGKTPQWVRDYLHAGGVMDTLRV